MSKAEAIPSFCWLLDVDIPGLSCILVLPVWSPFKFRSVRLEKNTHNSAVNPYFTTYPHDRPWKAASTNELGFNPWLSDQSGWQCSNVCRQSEVTRNNLNLPSWSTKRDHAPFSHLQVPVSWPRRHSWSPSMPAALVVSPGYFYKSLGVWLKNAVQGWYLAYTNNITLVYISIH